MYLILFGTLGGYFYISGIIYRGHYNTEFFVPYTYVEAVFTLFFTALQSFLTHYEALLIKDVSYPNNIIYFVFIIYLTHNYLLLLSAAIVRITPQFRPLHIS